MSDLKVLAARLRAWLADRTAAARNIEGVKREALGASPACTLTLDDVDCAHLTRVGADLIAVGRPWTVHRSMHVTGTGFRVVLREKNGAELARDVAHVAFFAELAR